MTDPETGAVTGGELRAVLDTNVPIAAHLSHNPHSPTIELLVRWRGGQFIQLYSDDMLVELAEKFQTRNIAPDAANRYLADLITLGEFVIVSPEQVPDMITADPDDNAILACAFIGRASHIVTYDPHFDALGGAYQGIPILDGLHFLYVVRGDRLPETSF
ncbi:MAG: putative toxin-antitoxin system toxin component, PIN family [Caldilineales bacterium]|nr:putative toxin-antitoxin system toxin component, PIN family [Caldilineales bacterium]MCW5860158.1 putative toxin-antitoxin system toxin component, PIN family [Caldilineales bacterium]